MNCITINTDASFHPTKKTSGYAFYIVCDLFKITKGGHFKQPVINILEAETKCIGNALATLLSQDLPKVKLIVVNTDSLFAINSILRNRKSLNVKMREIVKKVETKTGGTVEFRHVKAHTNNKDSRSWVNKWCDKESKKWMKNEKIQSDIILNGSPSQRG